METASIGTTGLKVTRLGLGGAPLAGLFSDVAEEAAVQTVRRALDLGVRYIDTAPFYGRGRSELQIGRALAGVPRDGFVLSTKVGRLLEPADTASDPAEFAAPLPFDVVFDYSRDGVLRSLEESLQRLNLDRIDIALIHDLDTAEEGDPGYWRTAVEGAYPTLDRLRSEGVVGAIGAGLNSAEPLVRLAREGDFDCFLLAGRYTLLDQSGLAELLPLCEERRISIILGGPYNSGILASDLSSATTYFYKDAPPDVLERARQLKAASDRFEVPLKAAALQFGLAHPAVAATIPGARSATEVEENVEMAGYPIPNELWDELHRQGLIPDRAPTPGTNEQG